MQSREGIARVFNSILGYAVVDGALAAKIEVTRDAQALRDLPENRGEGIAVFYLLEDIWRQRLTMSADIHRDLLAEIRARASMEKTQNEGEFSLDLRDEKNSLRLCFQVRVAIAASGEITLAFSRDSENIGYLFAS